MVEDENKEKYKEIKRKEQTLTSLLDLTRLGDSITTTNIMINRHNDSKLQIKNTIQNEETVIECERKA